MACGKCQSVWTVVIVIGVIGLIVATLKNA